jgi:hypothetical protein
MTPIVQALLSLVIGWGVFVLWRRVGASSRPVYWLVTLGVLVRAVGGQLAFWVSYLHLPFARSLQIGDGLWIFAVDATRYFEIATGAASGGLPAIVSLDRSNASVFFVQTLAMFVLTVGAVTSVAVLLNVAAYLGCCRAILSFGDPKQYRSVVFAIAALSLSPSAVVWSLQPLKDTLFLFLVAAFFGAARLWQQLWSDEAHPRRLPRAVVTTLVMVVVLYGISGIRWYFGIVIVLASLPFVLLTTIRSRQRWAVVANALVLVPLLGAAFLSGAGPYVPTPVREAFLGRDVKKHVELPNTLLGYVGQAREGFDRAGGATMIATGGTTRQFEATLDAKKPREQPSGALAVAPPVKSSVPHELPPAAPRVRAAPVPIPMSSAMGVQPAPVHPVAVAAALAVVSVTALATPAPAVKGVSSSATVSVPSSRMARLVAGTAAVVLPHVIAQQLGILDVGGGHGLWLFVELDTIAFDVVLIFALVSLVRALRRGSLRAPVFWMILLVTLAIGGALVYAVSNFGTLFRHRDMVLLGLALLPLAALAEQPRGERTEEVVRA